MVQSTSIQAFKNDVLPRINYKQQVVFTALMKIKRPACNQEIADFLAMPINQITPRMNELVKLHAVREAFKDVYAPTGRTVIYWEIKPEEEENE